MQFKQVSFDDYLHSAHLSLSILGYSGIKIEELRNLADVECVKLLKSNLDLQDYLGNPILKHQIKKCFFPFIKSNNIIIRSNIFDLITLIAQNFNLQQIEIPYSVKSKVDIYKQINTILQDFKPADYYYLIDEWGLDNTQINANNNLIIVSSIDAMYGIKGLNICWAYIYDSKLYNFLAEYCSFAGSSCSHYAEIYALIALRNNALIQSINNKLLKENHHHLETFLKKYYDFISYQWAGLRTFCKISFNKIINVEEIKNKYKIIIKGDNFGALYIHYGQVDFAKDLAKLDMYLSSINPA